MNHFEKFNKANRKFILQKIIDFLSIMSVFWLYRLEIILYDKGTLCIIYFACLFASLFVTINVKMAEPIWLKFFVGPHMTLGKVYGLSKLKKLSLQHNEIFIKFYKFVIFFLNPRTFLLKFYNFYKRKC